MIALDLCQHHCQALLIIGQRFTKKNVKNAKKEKTSITKCRFIGIEDNKLSYKCIKCSDKSHKSINGLDKKSPSIYKFCNSDLNKFALLLRKGIYPYEYMDSWETFNETTSKEAFYSNLNLEGITDEAYNHAQKVWDVFKIRNLGEYHDLYVQSDTLLLADYLKILEIIVSIFMSLIHLILYLLQD